VARVLIAGCGYVGSALARRLVGAGDTVWGVRRSAAGEIPGVRSVRADLADPATFGALPEGIERVVIAASPDERSEAAYRAVYVEGAANLLGALASRGEAVTRVILVSSTGVYGERGGGWVDEDTPPEPSTPTGRVLLEGERRVLDGPFPAVVLRLAGIYGPGREGMIRDVRSGRAACPPEPRWTNRIHRDDAAGAVAHLLALPAPAPLYVGVDRESAELCTVYRWIADRLGLPAPPAGEANRGRGGSKRCRGDRLAASGYRFAYPTFREGYEAMIRAEEGGALH
jgi:nucleoside-diphosphate-sugar epimerase